MPLTLQTVARRFRRANLRRRTRRGFAGVLGVALFVGVLLPARASDPETEIEKLFGKAISYALREASGIDDDPLLLGWVRRIGSDVSAVSSRKNVKYSFEILGSDVANAQAAPGGYIFVTRGLLDSVESDEELAGVLAHETGHVAKHHAAQQFKENLLVLALLSQVRDRKYNGVKLGASILNVFRVLGKSREMERQADEEGLVFSYQSGYDPKGLVRFLQSLGTGKRSVLDEYTATHPAPEARVKNAQKSPLINPTDEKIREKIADGYAKRGLLGASQTIRNGGDPLFLPPLPPLPLLSPLEQSSRDEIVARDKAVRYGLVKSWKAQKNGDALQSVLLINSNTGDLRWNFITARAVAVQTRISDIYSRTLRVSQTAAPTFDALIRSEAQAPGSDDVRINAALGRSEARRALANIQGVPSPIGRAANTADVVLLDLNNRFYRPKGAAAWTRYAALEGMLRYAESELARADKESGRAWRIMSLARMRRYELEINTLAPQDNAMRRALWYDLARRRLGRDFDQTGNAGGATIRAAISVETGQSEADINANRGASPWADWVVEKRGVPENIATVLRLLVLDMRREIAARETTGGPPNPPVFP